MGKSRVAKNALWHGLAIPVDFDTTLGPEIERVARAIAGEGAGLARQERARRVAEAQIDLIRIRRARLALLDDPSARIKPELKQADSDFDGDLDKTVGEIVNGQPADGVFPTLAEGLDVLAPKLAGLDRYERRALSRRRRAIKELMR